jgi:predicted nucleotidyltransferase
METTRNRMNDNVTKFFKALSNHIGTQLLFFGSIQRNDYYEGKSDIDVDIFTENETATMMKMRNFLKVPKEMFKKIVWKLNINGRLVYGHKIFYEDPSRGIFVEFSIYNEKFKKDVLKEHLRKVELPFYALWLLNVLKFFFYKLNLIEKKTFNYLKKKILSLGIGLPEDKFVVFDEHPEEKYRKKIVY